MWKGRIFQIAGNYLWCLLWYFTSQGGKEAQNSVSPPNETPQQSHLKDYLYSFRFVFSLSEKGLLATKTNSQIIQIDRRVKSHAKGWGYRTRIDWLMHARSHLQACVEDQETCLSLNKAAASFNILQQKVKQVFFKSNQFSCLLSLAHSTKV